MKKLSENRRARFDYDIGEKIEAGIELTGQETKSSKDGRFDISASYAIIKNGQAWLLNSKIPPYQPKNTPADYDPSRTRRLLLHINEIKKLTGLLHQKGINLIPLQIYLKNNRIKVGLGIGRSRKKMDKREVIKRRETQREIRREVKRE